MSLTREEQIRKTQEHQLVHHFAQEVPGSAGEILKKFFKKISLDVFRKSSIFSIFQNNQKFHQNLVD